MTTPTDGSRPGVEVRHAVTPEGLADAGVYHTALANEGFAGAVPFSKPPEGLVASDGATPPKVDGFAASGGGTPPAVEGFADSSDNRGLKHADVGFLDQEEEPVTRRKRVAEESDPESREAQENVEANKERVNLEPGWEEANLTAAERVNQDRGEEAGAEEGPLPTPLVPHETLFDGRYRFTAQLQARGYGGFHEWRMQMIKGLLEQRRKI
ncbi:MAG: hypothetical protein HQM06_17375 [Magnetococcales bacterium]|nr:hypothetical protein [Magnetococcales bacterium]